MRCTAEILSDVKENLDVDKEELRLALLVLDSINFFNHGHLKRLLKGGLAADLTKREFPGAHADLGISKTEYDCMKMDPNDYLGPDHIPGTPEWEKFHIIATRIFNKVMNDEANKTSTVKGRV